MKPQTHEKLTQAAKNGGFDTLGDWLDQLPLTSGQQAEIGLDWDEVPFADLCCAFRECAEQAISALAHLHELVDMRPELIKNRTNATALADLNRTHASLQRLIRNL